MAKSKKLVKQLKLQITGGQANPAPPLGPIIGQEGINIAEFTSQFNEKTREHFMGQVMNVRVNVYEDRSFVMTIKTPATSSLIKKAARIEKGSGKNVTEKAGTITKNQVKEIAEQKMADLNARDLEGAMKMVEGAARSMGVDVK